jgi:arginase
MQNRNLILNIIGYDSGWGCRDFGCEDGPGKVDIAGIQAALKNAGIESEWQGLLELKNLGDHALLNTKEKTLPLVIDGLKKLSAKVMESAKAQRIPLVLGGDHSSAIGTWSSVVTAQQSAGNFGLIWIDAHLDSHTYETSHQGKWGGWWHGQPVAALTGNGLPEFTSLNGAMTKVSPENITFIGVHSFEPAEEEYVKKHDIRVYPLDEVESRGFAAVYQEALVRATAGTSGFGLSVDLDAFQQSDAPGVGSAEGNGLKAAEVLPILESVGRHPLFKALEIVEFNPHNDIDGKTRQLITALVASIFRS